jgi:hypothetical protein
MFTGEGEVHSGAAKRGAGKQRRHRHHEDTDPIEPLQFGELDLEPLPAPEDALPSDEEHDRLGELPFVGELAHN